MNSRRAAAHARQLPWPRRHLGTSPFGVPAVDRRSAGNSLKWAAYGPDVLPMWIADMDFRSPDCILDALHRRCEHGVFGYTDMRAEDYVDPALAYLAQKHDAADLEPSMLTWLPGLVPGLNLACQTTPAAGDEVLVLTPIYPPFLSAPANAGRKAVRVPLLLPDSATGEPWRPDFPGMEAAVTSRTKMLLLCNPHNPVGRVFSRSEITKLLEFCDRCAQS